MSLPLPYQAAVQEVVVCYQLQSPSSFISQVRLVEMTTPNVAQVRHDDPTDLKSTTPASYTSVIRGFVPAAALTLELRLNFQSAAKSISLGAGDAGVFSAEAIQNITFRDCVMEKSTLGLTANNHSSSYWHDILFDGCVFRNNRFGGAATGGAALPQNNFRFVNCISENNLDGPGFYSGGSVGIQLIGCRSEGNLGGHGFEFYEPKDFVLRDCSCVNSCSAAETAWSFAKSIGNAPEQPTLFRSRFRSPTPIVCPLLSSSSPIDPRAFRFSRARSP
jgi:hypothetical protein